MYLNNRFYDILKLVAQYLLPGLSTLYFALSGIWGLPNTLEVMGTLVALSVFLGAILGISSMQYHRERALEGDNPLVDQYGIQRGEEPLPTNPWGLSGQYFELMKWVAITLLPATGALYFTVATLWGFSFAEQVLGTVAALAVFMNVMLGVSTARHENR